MTNLNQIISALIILLLAACNKAEESKPEPIPIQYIIAITNSETNVDLFNSSLYKVEKVKINGLEPLTIFPTDSLTLFVINPPTVNNIVIDYGIGKNDTITHYWEPVRNSFPYLHQISYLKVLINKELLLEWRSKNQLDLLSANYVYPMPPFRGEDFSDLIIFKVEKEVLE
jgi:hypothetical protein